MSTVTFFLTEAREPNLPKNLFIARGEERRKQIHAFPKVNNLGWNLNSANDFHFLESLNIMQSAPNHARTHVRTHVFSVYAFLVFVSTYISVWKRNHVFRHWPKYACAISCHIRRLHLLFRTHSSASFSSEHQMELFSSFRGARFCMIIIVVAIFLSASLTDAFFFKHFNVGEDVKVSLLIDRLFGSNQL